MVEKKIQRNIEATDEEWKVIQATAKERGQTSSGFLMSIAQKETGGEENPAAKTISNIAKVVHFATVKVCKNPDLAEVAKLVHTFADKMLEKSNEESTEKTLKVLVGMALDSQQSKDYGKSNG